MGMLDNFFRNRIENSPLRRTSANSNSCETSKSPSLRWWKALLAVFIFAITLHLLLGEHRAAAQAAAPELLNLNSVDESADSPHQLGYHAKNNDNFDTSLEEPRAKLQPQQLVSRTYPAPALEPAAVSVNRADHQVSLNALPSFNSTFGGKIAGMTAQRQIVFYSLDPELQRFTEKMVNSSKSPHVAAVAMDPHTGKILAISDKSSSIKNLAVHTGFPAASLFKVVTAAAAIENTGLTGDSLIPFRGGTYTLERWNYLPDKKRDRRSMSLAQALGMSCNPVFGRVALLHLNPSLLQHYTRLFGFNDSAVSGDLPLNSSSAMIPTQNYELSRTGAGFGEVTISPVHAATMMSGIANGGLMPRASLIDRVVDLDGNVIYEPKDFVYGRMVQPDTARELLNMMEYTTTTGTSRREFMRKNGPVMPGIPVAAKTGTLRGSDPEGLNTWFIAAAPKDNPKVAVAVIVVNPTNGSKASHLGKLMLEQYLTGTTTETYQQVVTQSKAKTKKTTQSSKSTKKKTVAKVTVKKSTTKHTKK